MLDTSSPTLLLDEQKVRKNIERMVKKAEANNLTFKPHFKTHQSVQVGRWFKNNNVDKITVSSIKMAEYFADDGWQDITIAFPCNVLEIDRINKLAEKVSLSLLASDPKTIAKINTSLQYAVQIYIEIDTGSHRTGLRPDQTEVIERLLDQIQDSVSLNFRGFYSHPGHSYSAQSKEEIRTIQRRAVSQMQRLKAHFEDRYPELVCCLGDTPCCSVGKKWEGIDEMSPGNFVFYDLMQAEAIGSCKADDIAVALACPVVGTYPERNEIAIHGGAIHLSKESLKINAQPVFGRIVRLKDDFTWNRIVDNTYVKSISQEHGIIKCSAPFFERIEIGDIIGVLPVHSCLTADTMKGYHSCRTADIIDHLQATH